MALRPYENCHQHLNTDRTVGRRVSLTLFFIISRAGTERPGHDVPKVP